MDTENRISALKGFLGRHRAPILFVVVGLAVYANSFQNQMFWDDNDSILNNAYVREAQFPKFFSENLIAGAGFGSNFWRPMLLSVFSLEWNLFGTWTAGYHFASAALHIANALLLFSVLFALFRKRRVAMLASLIFLVHPLQTEAITYVAGMGDPLSVFFMLAGMLFFLKFREFGAPAHRSGYYFLALFMYALSLMSKETAIIMPALLLLADFFLARLSACPAQAGGGVPSTGPATTGGPSTGPATTGGQISLAEKAKNIGKAVWPFFALGALYVLLRATVLNFGGTFNLYGEENAFTSNAYIRIFTFFQVLASYFGLLFSPFGLHMERGMEMATSFFSAPVIIGALISFGLLALAFTQFRRYPVVSFGILWFFIGLTPTSNILVPINGLIYEHWLYLPMVGIFLSLVWLGDSLARKYGAKRIFLAAVAVFAVFLSLLTVNRNRDWRDPITFYNQTLKYSPDSYRVINNLGMAYDDRGDYAQAEAAYKRAIAVASSSPVAYHNLGNTYQKTGRAGLAAENYQIAIGLDPRFAPSYGTLLELLLKSGDETGAKKVYEDYKKAFPPEK